ncbi:MAG: hypothetical protein GY861_22545 [bacterium]|nr:hypothetical protein [bacterium]
MDRKYSVKVICITRKELLEVIKTFAISLSDKDIINTIRDMSGIGYVISKCWNEKVSSNIYMGKAYSFHEVISDIISNSCSLINWKKSGYDSTVEVENNTVDVLNYICGVYSIF